MRGERTRWRALPEGLHFGSSLLISFQRYLVADAPALPDIPTSLGALNAVEVERGVFLVPVCDNEAVWLGIQFLKEDEPIRVLVGDPPEWHEFALACSISHGVETVAALPGPRGALRFGPLANECSTIEFDVPRQARGRARVEFVDLSTFERLAGRAAPAPARREDGYGGWRLP